MASRSSSTSRLSGCAEDVPASVFGTVRRRFERGDGRDTSVPCAFRSLLLVLVLSWLAAAATAAPLTDEATVAIRRLLEVRPPAGIVVGRSWPVDGKVLGSFYRQRGYRPAWLDDHGVSPLAAELLDALRSVGEYGLCVEDYPTVPLQQLWQQVEDARRIGLLYDPHDLARLDLLLSESFLRLGSDLEGGRVRGPAFHGRTPAPRPPDPAARFGTLLTHASVAGYLQALLPADPGYRQLQARLGEYRQLAARGGWPQIAPGELPPLGGSDARLSQLRRRLELSGDLVAGDVSPDAPYDPATEAALLHFQRRHGLPGDARLTPATLDELNLTVEQRIRQLELNLERARWLPRVPAEREVRVNIAAYSLTASRGGTVELTMPVVVGSAYRQTPVYSSRIGRIEFAPHWTVPRTILAEDKLPKIRRDPDYLRRHHYTIVRQQDGETLEVDPAAIDWRRVTAATFPGLLRMAPGPWNPLGRVKFLFANPYDVYLHDTSDPQLFQREERGLSSGCIRVARPVDLALFLLAGEGGWNERRVQAAMARKELLPVGLSQPVPVHIVYATAWVDATGDLQFRRDVYLRDHELEQALWALTAQRNPLIDPPPAVLLR